ncbi:hypothetical protein FRC08_002580 [Ceratobasidium sp. 394]|nr:hypothetical protein FRC08_002580 [Ceratobasidium sp. 394]
MATVDNHRPYDSRRYGSNLSSNSTRNQGYSSQTASDSSPWGVSAPRRIAPRDTPTSHNDAIPPTSSAGGPPSKFRRRWRPKKGVSEQTAPSAQTSAQRTPQRPPLASTQTNINNQARTGRTPWSVRNPATISSNPRPNTNLNCLAHRDNTSAQRSNQTRNQSSAGDSPSNVNPPISKRAAKRRRAKARKAEAARQQQQQQQNVQTAVTQAQRATAATTNVNQALTLPARPSNSSLAQGSRNDQATRGAGSTPAADPRPTASTRIQSWAHATPQPTRSTPHPAGTTTHPAHVAHATSNPASSRPTPSASRLVPPAPHLARTTPHSTHAAFQGYSSSAQGSRYDTVAWSSLLRTPRNTNSLSGGRNPPGNSLPVSSPDPPPRGTPLSDVWEPRPSAPPPPVPTAYFSHARAIPSRRTSSLCSICLDLSDEFPRRPPTTRCTHTTTVCAPCLEQHISYAVLTNGSTTITCPDAECRQTLEFSDVKVGARNDKRCFARYETLVLRRALQSEPNFVWCKNPQCDAGQVHESGAAAPIVTCRVCRAQSCFTHDVPWHVGLTCTQYTAQRANTHAVEDRASEECINRIAKTCPNASCGRRVRI